MKNLSNISAAQKIGKAEAINSCNSNAASRFWPIRENHTIHSVEFSRPSKIFDEETLSILKKVTQLSEIVRNFQDIHNFGIERLNTIDNLYQEIAELMEIASDRLFCEASAQSLRMRAKALRKRDVWKKITSQAIKLDERQLLSVCGNLSTWYGKFRSSQMFHSALFATVDARFDSLIGVLNAKRDALQDYLRKTVHPLIELRSIPNYKVGHLFLCGGEANRYPKHFAYFLPEDEGIKDSLDNRTIVFSNVYLKMYKRISEVLGLATLEIKEAVKCPSVQQIQNHLLLWFRGHDIGHSVILPETNYRILDAQGEWVSMALQEALADCYGYLMIVDGPWLEIVQDLSPKIAATTFLSEMLRYMSRGKNYFPDSSAAFMEFNFLVNHGYLHIDSVRNLIIGSCDSVTHGIQKLTKVLTQAILTNDEAAMQAFVKAYYTENQYEIFARFGLYNAELEYIQSY